MNKMTLKRMIAALLALVLLSACTGCGRQEKDTGLQQTKEELLDACFSLLEAYEQMYSGLFRSVEYMGTYAKTSSWEDLLKARGAANAAIVAIRQLDAPVFRLTAEEIELLTDAGIEANAVQREFENFEDMRSDKEITATLFVYTLENDVFLSAVDKNTIPAMAALYQTYLTLEGRYLCIFANDMLIQMDSEGLWSDWAEKLPWVTACADSWYGQVADAEAAAGNVLDEIQALQPRLSGFSGTGEYTLEIVEDALESGNNEVLRKELAAISDVPGYFPNPAWLPDVIRVYLTTDGESGEKRIIQAGEPVDSTPSACYISCGAISLENVENYEQCLAQWGIPTYGTWNEAQDAYSLLVKSGSSTMLVTWEQEETVLYLPEPIGCMIPELYLYAMNAE